MVGGGCGFCELYLLAGTCLGLKAKSLINTSASSSVRFCDIITAKYASRLGLMEFVGYGSFETTTSLPDCSVKPTNFHSYGTGA